MVNKAITFTFVILMALLSAVGASEKKSGCVVVNIVYHHRSMHLSRLFGFSTVGEKNLKIEVFATKADFI